MSGNAVAFTIVIIMFAVVSGVGFAAARWRRAEDKLHLNEWGLGGRGFGTFITWFLLGGDLYTAYTFIAVPAVIFGAGAAGFFAVPYTIIVFPIVFVFAPRLWSVSRVHGYITPADFVRGRYGSQGLALAVAVTGILATMPYIALQLVGIQAVLTVMGVHGDWPLVIAFAVLAAYTWVSGLRAPALIAFIKDTLVYVMVIVAILYLPTKVGALLFAITLPKTFSINLQLLGGIWILQTFPSIVFGLFTRWFHRYALLAGWLAGMIFGTVAAYRVSSPTASHWAGSVDTLFGHTVYIGLSAIILNLAVPWTRGCER